MRSALRSFVVGLLSMACLTPGMVSAQSADTWRTDFTRHTVPLEEIVPGGPPKGEALLGELAGTALEPIPHGNHFWFGWAAFKPGTQIRR
jgi:hypothetical protein